MRIISILLTICVIVVAWPSCGLDNEASTTERVIRQYKSDLSLLQAEVENLRKVIEANADVETVHAAFAKARTAYKKVEWLAEYYQPYTARFINGPALDEVEPDDKTITIAPEGFQVIEELLFPEPSEVNTAELVHQVKTLSSNIGRLEATAANLHTTDAHIFDALRLQVFRMVTLGISGFDAPIAHSSITEAKATVACLQQYFSIYKPLLTKGNGGVSENIAQLLNNALQYLSANNDFDTFDRLHFITEFANPIAAALLNVQKLLGYPLFTEPRLLRADAPHIFAADAFNPDFYAPEAGAQTTPAKVALGKQLFFDPVLSVAGNRSCGTCHQPEKAFADGLKTNTALTKGLQLRRNTPSLLNAALQPALFYDTRVSSLEDQAKDVIHNKEEMHGSLVVAAKRLNSDPAYQFLFAAAFPERPISEYGIKNAIAAYVRSLIALNSRFDQYMQGNKAVMNKTEIEGFNLFMGKAKCGTCHFAPLFNGSNPPGFTKIDSEVIGVPAIADSLHPLRDDDEGKFYTYGIPLYRFAFKTPTVRNIALTAPYMHNGVYQTLEEVVAFYNRGGGRGLGLPISNQTLPEEKLHLTDTEQKAIIAFMHALNDTTIRTTQALNVLRSMY